MLGGPNQARELCYTAPDEATRDLTDFSELYSLFFFEKKKQKSVSIVVIYVSFLSVTLPGKIRAPSYSDKSDRASVDDSIDHVLSDDESGKKRRKMNLPNA